MSVAIVGLSFILLTISVIATIVALVYMGATWTTSKTLATASVVVLGIAWVFLIACMPLINRGYGWVAVRAMLILSFLLVLAGAIMMAVVTPITTTTLVSFIFAFITVGLLVGKLMYIGHHHGPHVDVHITKM